MKHHGTILGSAVLALSLAAGAAAEQAEPPQRFVREATTAGMYEVQAARVAVERAQNVKICAFARQMLAEHREANAELTRLANRYGIIAA